MWPTYFLFSIVFILFTYVVFRVLIKRDYENLQKLSPLSYALEILVFAIHVNSLYLILPTQWPELPKLPENGILNIISGIIFCIGAVMLMLSWFTLGTGQSLGIDKNKLNTAGVYRYSRNPQLLSYGIMLMATVVLFFSLLMLFWFLLYLIISYLMIKSEEEFLKQKYPDRYTGYCKQVPRIIGFTQFHGNE